MDLLIMGIGWRVVSHCIVQQCIEVKNILCGGREFVLDSTVISDTLVTSL